jgi:hypothetical protein
MTIGLKKLFGLALAAGMSAATAQAVEAEPANAPPQWSGLYDVFKDVSCGHRFTIAGDTRHSDPEIFHFLAQDRVFDALKACGIGQIYLEYRPEQQKLFDAFMTGGMDRAAFVAALDQAVSGSTEDKARRLADILEQAKERGIAVFAAQSPTGVEAATLFQFYDQMAFSALGALVPKDLRADYDRYVKGEAITPERKQAIFTEIAKRQDSPEYRAANDFFAMADQYKAAAFKGRGDDALLVEDVMKRSKGGKALIVVGDGHPQTPETGIAARLGSEAGWVTLQSPRGSPPSAPNALKPAYVLDLKTGQALRPD